MNIESHGSEVDELLREVLSLADSFESAKKERDISNEIGGRVSASMNIDTSLGQSNEKIDGSPKNTTNTIPYTDTSPYLDYRKTLETKKAENTPDPAEQVAEYVRGVGDLLDAMRSQAGAPK